jgi:signal transduction histidine kinase
MLFVVVAEADDLRIAWLAWTLIGAAGLMTAWLAIVRTRRPDDLLRAVYVLAELALGVALLVCDGLVFKHGHVFGPTSSLAAGWPIAGVLSAGVAFGTRPGLAAGTAMGVSHFVAAPLNGVHVSGLDSSQVVSVSSSFVLYMLVGAVAGYAVGLIRRSDDLVARARAREEVARTLHDGVLQTLAFVERRVTDPQLAAMAREQERELRGFLADYDPVPARRSRLSRTPGVTRRQLEERLRAASARLEDTYGGRVDVVVAEDLGALTEDIADAMTGAVGEALVNAGKHGRATKATVFVEPTEPKGVFCSVKDDGVGFVVGEVTERLGLSKSIRGRVESAGGRIELSSTPGLGTEVRMWL